MLLYGQLQEDLLYTLLESPSVSGAQNFALQLKEKREDLLNLKMQHYLRAQPRSPINSGPANKPSSTTQH